MESQYLYAEIETAQSSKKTNICGDVVHTIRRSEGTLVLLCDGIGAGIKANLAARMLIARATELMNRGFSQRAAFTRLVETQNQFRTNGSSYVAFSLIWIRPDGYADILTHDGPTPLFLPASGKCRPVKMEYQSLGKAVVGEGSSPLQNGDSILLVSDGITQAGLGKTCPEGWPESRIADFINHMPGRESHRSSLAHAIHRKALELWARPDGDDCTAVCLTLRPARQVSILTGPPADSNYDTDVVQRFMRSPGRKIICGGTTSNIAARVLNRSVNILNQAANPWMPPAFAIDGIDLVTEGIVTLNQVANLITINPEELTGDSTVETLCAWLRGADRINFIVGSGFNPEQNDTVFRQIGVVERVRIVEILTRQLQAMDKLVVAEKT